jgi:SAM-dependent methyltransferase
VSVDFDRYKDVYPEEVQRSIDFIGQDVDFFAELKAQYLLDVGRRFLGRTGSLSFLDVGCGVGLTDGYLKGAVDSLHGVDVAAGALERARERNPWAQYSVYDGSVLPVADGSFDLTFAICVLHHVEPARWPDFASELARATRPDGLVVVIEHNPLNPLTRLAVSRCEFDEDAVLLPARRTRKLLGTAGLTVRESRYIAFFPWRGNMLRAVERRLGWLPLGAQYAVAGARS